MLSLKLINYTFTTFKLQIHDAMRVLLQSWTAPKKPQKTGHKATLTVKTINTVQYKQITVLYAYDITVYLMKTIDTRLQPIKLNHE